MKTGKVGIDEKCVMLGLYIIENNATVRSAAKQYGIAKSTVYDNITKNLSQINHQLYTQVATVLNINLHERHIRGGMATKAKHVALYSEGV